MKTEHAIDWRKSAAEIQADFKAACKQRDDLRTALEKARCSLAIYARTDKAAKKATSDIDTAIAIASVKSYGKPEKTAETEVPAIVFYPAGSLGEEVEP
jgi:hypothetical protein